ncbi:pilus assembly protein TadG-related protein [Occallatibacter savannae]|uniref:pilus assembly protein TadG-related protein n=1 Tax=Occallatibacter savannae TaxID=1002691 RepID=UPI0013A5AA08|nr:pilus assembly protein TadG-related protein [Occallatibacter savannae]
MKIREREGGQVLVLTALCAVILMGFLALAIDVGLLFRAKRNVQIAADAAATSAALDYYYNASTSRSSIDTAAASAASAVGRTAALTDGMAATDTITVDTAWDGAFAGRDGYFEAIIRKPVHAMFMGIFTGNFVTVAARAVAGTPYASNYCVYALKSQGDVGNGGNGNGIGKGTSGFYLFGSSTVITPHCGIVINGRSSDALNLQDTKDRITAGSIAVTGGCDSNKSTNCTSLPLTTGVAPVEDPLQGVGQPTKPTTQCTGSVWSNCYIDSGSDPKKPLSVKDKTMSGTLFVTGTGGISLGGTITSGTTGATIYLQSGGMTETSGTTFAGSSTTGNGIAGFSAPGSGPLSGIALMAPPSNSSILEFAFGNCQGSFNGIVYAPNAALYLHDSAGSLTVNADLVVGEIDDQAATLTVNSYSAANPTTTPLKAVALVE